MSKSLHARLVNESHVFNEQQVPSLTFSLVFHGVVQQEAAS